MQAPGCATEPDSVAMVLAPAHDAEPRHAEPEVRPTPEQVSARRRAWLAEAAVVGLLFAIALSMRVSTLSQPLVESHGFRQTQTALTARIFHEEGIDLLHPKLPIFGESEVVPFEFPLFQAIASVPMAHGVSPDTSMRLTSLVFFFLTAGLLYGLARRLGGVAAGVVALAVFLFSPLNLLWSRTSMIEYLATAAAVGWAWAGMAWRDRRTPVLAAAAVLSGAVAMLVKPATAIFWVLPLLVYRPEGERTRDWREFVKARRDPVLIAMAAVPFVLAALWTRHADAMKAPYITTHFLTSGELNSWNFGSLDQRLDVAQWRLIGARIKDLCVGLPLWQLPAVVALGLVLKSRAVVAAIALSAAATLLVFFNLYWVHDYYFAAITPQLAIVAGCAGAAVLGVARRLPMQAVVAGVLALWLVSLPLNAKPYWRAKDLDAAALAGHTELARELAAATAPSDKVVFEGFTWSPVMPYYAHRNGVMLTYQIYNREVLDSLPSGPYAALLSAGYNAQTAEVLDRWALISTPSSHVYYLANAPDRLRPAKVVAARDAAAFPVAGRANPSLIAARQEIPCTGAAIPVVTRGRWTWLRFEGKGAEGVVVNETNAAAIPSNRVIAVPPQTVPTGAPIHVRCMEGEKVTLVAAVDAPGPPGA